jgi:hypothetical protein
VILHIDGLSHRELVAAVGDRRMEAVRRLLEQEGYEALEYRSGLPSTTPYVQAGLLYGDNREIPGFRWWDRKAGTIVQFGPEGTFKQIAHRYFRGARPLCEGGACIAACYPAGAAETFGLTYRDRVHEAPGEDRGAREVLRAWVANPAHIADMVWHGTLAAATTSAADVRARLRRRRPARNYLILDVLEEVFLHHQCRWAVTEAMDRGYPVIYAAFYAYDETGHALGIDDEHTRRMLVHVDHSVRQVADARSRNRSGRRYELIVLSDHGQVLTTAIKTVAGCSLGELVARAYPGCRVEEHSGDGYGPERTPRQRIVITDSGGLAHIYFAGSPDRLDVTGVRRRLPDFLTQLSGLPGVGFAVVRDGRTHLAVTRDRTVRFAEGDPGEAHELFATYDDAALVAAQLARLNSFENSGDVLLIGRWDTAERRQVNFEDQLGGHGSIGGDQGRPFLLVKRQWGIDVEGVSDAHQVHDKLWEMRRQFAGSTERTSTSSV